ncbi:MAG: hypothetical protein C0486_09020 [Erythrobacter sp.]|nr:hypothetical protein [Erythrobacter sp.]MBA4081885.1 hypothetical protein [Erythrobacter sp.]
MRFIMRLPLGAAVCVLYYIVAGLIGISAGYRDQAAAEGIVYVGILFGLLIVFFWDDHRAKIAAVMLHMLLLGWCAIQ